jgi:hypothetical protein
MNTSATKAGASPWFLWWKIAPAELQTQAAGYSALKPHQSARGQSAFALLFSAVVTAGVVAFRNGHAAGYAEAALFVTLAIFIWRGQRWACLAAMAFWSLEKAFALIAGLQGQGPNAFVTIVWWILYMKFFYLAFRVEQARRNASNISVEVFD